MVIWFASTHTCLVVQLHEILFFLFVYIFSNIYLDILVIKAETQLFIPTFKLNDAVCKTLYSEQTQKNEPKNLKC